MELILLAIGGIVWAVIKALAQGQPAQQRPVPRPAAPMQIPIDPPPRPEPAISDPYAVQQPEREILHAVEELDERTLSFDLTAETFVQGVILSEVLGSPRAQTPHRLYRQGIKRRD